MVARCWEGEGGGGGEEGCEAAGRSNSAPWRLQEQRPLAATRCCARRRCKAAVGHTPPGSPPQAAPAAPPSLPPPPQASRPPSQTRRAHLQQLGGHDQGAARAQLPHRLDADGHDLGARPARRGQWRRLVSGGHVRGCGVVQGQGGRATCERQHVLAGSSSSKLAPLNPPVVHKLVDQRAQHRLQHLGRHQLVAGLQRRWRRESQRPGVRGTNEPTAGGNVGALLAPAAPSQTALHLLPSAILHGTAQHSTAQRCTALHRTQHARQQQDSPARGRRG